MTTASEFEEDCVVLIEGAGGEGVCSEGEERPREACEGVEAIINSIWSECRIKCYSIVVALLQLSQLYVAGQVSSMMMFRRQAARYGESRGDLCQGTNAL